MPLPPAPGVSLPPLAQVTSPNQSQRLHGLTPYLVVVHRPVGSFESALATLTDPEARVSAHILTDSNRKAVQLVPWDRKAWTAGSFNSASYNLEVDDNAWLLIPGTLRPRDVPAFNAAARITAFICKRTGIPPIWSQQPTQQPGIVRHLDLGRAGGGHTDPTMNRTFWRTFVDQVRFEHDRGGFRPVYGVGALARIDV